MKNNQEQTVMDIVPKKKGSPKWKVYSVLVVLVVGAGAYGYWWFQDTNTLRAEAVQVLDEAKKYDTLRSRVDTERARCENFIVQKEGDFGSFEYCRKFVEWAETVLAAR